VASIVLVNTGDGFTWESEDLGRSAVIAREAWSAAEDTPSSGRYDLLVLDLADTVTEMRKVKHAYETGVRAKRGIDF
jgi:cob(I)alamin adenosyltransferase